MRALPRHMGIGQREHDVSSAQPKSNTPMAFNPINTPIIRTRMRRRRDGAEAPMLRQPGCRNLLSGLQHCAHDDDGPEGAGKDRG